MSLWEATAIATNTGEGFFIDDMDEEFEKFLGQIKSDQKKTSPEDKILLNEANELLKHCEEEEEFGPTQNPAKLDLQKFLFLKNVNNKKKVNKFLITNLAWLSDKNILLRYLLIEAGLRNKYVEKILKENNFYSVRNNPEDFYSENNVPEELRFHEITLKIKLKQYSIFTPEDSSYLVISSNAKKIIQRSNKKLILNLKTKMEYALQVLIYSNKFKDRTSRPSEGQLKSETDKELKKFYKSISYLYFFWSKSLVEAEFLKKSHNADSSYIIYLNNMYWLDTKLFQKFLEGFFFFPNLLIELYDKHTIGAEYFFNQITDYAEKIELDSQASKIRAKEMSGKKIPREEMEMYKEILAIKVNHSCGYLKASKIYSEKERLFWKPKKIKSISETIRKNHKNGLII